MIDPIQTINAIRNVPHSALRSRVERVAVVLTSPRSGSSLVKHVLDSHPEIASLNGEIEPFLALTGNGFGYNSDSDAIGVLSNSNALADNIFDDLTVRSEELPPLDLLKKRWENRLLLQFPCFFSKASEYCRLKRSLDEALTEMNVYRTQEEQALQALVLSKVFRNEPWRTGYYDGHLESDTNIFFNESVKIEEPPFVMPRTRRRPFTERDAQSKTLFFKTPTDVYRIGMYEQLFPNANVKYIHLTRGYAQSVNGLMDGWLSPIGFFSHNLRHAGAPLDIKGYSDSVKFGKEWWKFDLPPNWREFTTASLEDVCLNQWISAHGTILAHGVQALRIHFEEFLLEPSTTTKKITSYLGLREIELQPTLPVVMAVETPKMRRWRKRESQLLKMEKREEVREMMNSLGYEMDPETWL
jgi:hypothetical protein